jgi:hypothetical protein
VRLKNEYSDALNSVDLDLLQLHIKTGKTKSLPDDLVLYIELMEIVRGLYAKYETKTFIVNLLMMKPYELSRFHANRLYFDTLNFFYLDNSVKQKAWENIYATHLDNIAYYAIEKDDLETAHRCFMDAAKLRGVGTDEKGEMPAEMYNRPVIIYTIDAEAAGIKSTSRKELAEFIDKIPEISERERVRLNKDAGISEVTLFEDLPNEAK